MMLGFSFLWDCVTGVTLDRGLCLILLLLLGFNCFDLLCVLLLSGFTCVLVLNVVGMFVFCLY